MEAVTGALLVLIAFIILSARDLVRYLKERNAKKKAGGRNVFDFKHKSFIEIMGDNLSHIFVTFLLAVIAIVLLILSEQ